MNKNVINGCWVLLAALLISCSKEANKKNESITEQGLESIEEGIQKVEEDMLNFSDVSSAAKDSVSIGQEDIEFPDTVKLDDYSAVNFDAIDRYLTGQEGNELLEAMRLDRDTCSDSLRVIKVVTSPMFKEPSSAASEYVTLFNYIIGYRNEEYEEGIVQDMYEMLRDFPSKFTELEGYMHQLPEELQGKILDYLATAVAFVIAADNYGMNLQEMMKKFRNEFPFLAKYQICINEFIQTAKNNSNP